MAWSNRVNRAAVALTLCVAPLVMTSSVAGASGATVRDAKDGISFSLPTAWLQIPLTGKDVSGLLAAATRADPALKSALSSQVQQYVKKGVRIFAVGPIVRAIASNINVIVASSAGLPTGPTYFDQMGVQVKIGLATIGASNIVTTPIAVATSRQLEATYSLTSAAVKGTAYGVQLYIRHRSNLAVVTVTSASEATSRRIAHDVESTWAWS